MTDDKITMLCEVDDAAIATFTCPGCGKVHIFGISMCNETPIKCPRCGNDYTIYCGQSEGPARIIICGPPLERDPRNYGLEEYHEWQKEQGNRRNRMNRKEGNVKCLG